MNKIRFSYLDEACDKLRGYLSVNCDFDDEDHVISSIYSILMYFLSLHEKDFN